MEALVESAREEKKILWLTDVLKTFQIDLTTECGNGNGIELIEVLMQKIVKFAEKDTRRKTGNLRLKLIHLDRKFIRIFGLSLKQPKSTCASHWPYFEASNHVVAITIAWFLNRDNLVCTLLNKSLISVDEGIGYAVQRNSSAIEIDPMAAIFLSELFRAYYSGNDTDVTHIHTIIDKNYKCMNISEAEIYRQLNTYFRLSDYKQLFPPASHHQLGFQNTHHWQQSPPYQNRREYQNEREVRMAREQFEQSRSFKAAEYSLKNQTALFALLQVVIGLKDRPDAEFVWQLFVSGNGGMTTLTSMNESGSLTMDMAFVIVAESLLCVASSTTLATVQSLLQQGTYNHTDPFTGQKFPVPLRIEPKKLEALRAMAASLTVPPVP